MTTPRPHRKAGGFTLIEALAAGLILAVSAAAIGLTARQAVRSLDMARDYQKAAELLDRTLTKVDVVGPASLMLVGPAEGTFAPPDARFAWRTDIISMSQGSLYEVTVKVSWRTPVGDTKSVKAQTLLNDSRGVTDSSVRWEDL